MSSTERHTKNGDRKAGRRRVGTLAAPSRYALERLLKHPAGMGNPFPRTTRWHRVFQCLLDGLAELQGVGDGAGSFERLPLDRQRWTWTQAVLHTHRMMDAAEVVGDPSARARNVDRSLAWLNADIRIAALLGVRGKARKRDVQSILDEIGAGPRR